MFCRFIVNLVLCYHSFYKRLIQDSLKYLEEIEKMLSFSSMKENKDFLFNRINDALFHTTHSCRIYILEVTNQKVQAQSVRMYLFTATVLATFNRHFLADFKQN